MFANYDGQEEEEEEEEEECPMFADYDGRAADADHQRQQRRHIVSLLIRHARFALEAGSIN